MLFAVDSVPAVLAVSHEQFIVFSSNAFAILGLRALYFLLADLHGRFRYLQQGLAIILAFVGVKMIISEWYHIPTWLSLCHRARAGRRRSAARCKSTGERTSRSTRRRRAEHAADVRCDVAGPTPTRRHRRDAPVASAAWRSSTTTSSGCARRCRSSTSSAAVRARCARSGATGSGCARSTPRRRRRSTSARRPAATSASAATSRGDVFTFVQEIEHVDFVGAVEQLAAKAGIQLTLHHRPASRKERQRRKQLVEAMATAVEWYHERLLERPDARAGPRLPPQPRARRRRRPPFKLGWAPDDWDALSREAGHRRRPAARRRASAFTNRRDRLQDAFRARVLFPIFTENGEAVAIGGRILPGSTDPAKYKNSPETPIYAKSKTLYGLNWAKADIVAADQVDRVRGLHRRDRLPPRRRAAGGGHVRHGVHRGARAAAEALRQPGRAGVRRRRRRARARPSGSTSGSRSTRSQVSVARFPEGKDPGELAAARPGGAGARRSTTPLPFLGFRLRPGARAASRRASPEERARLGRAGDGGRQRAPRRQRAQAVRRPGRAAGRPAGRRPRARSPSGARGARRCSVSAAARAGPCARTPSSSPIALLAAGLGRRSPSGWSRSCSPTTSHRRAFLAVADAERRPRRGASRRADPEAREVLERAAVADLERRRRGRGPQPDRRGRAARARAGAARPAIPTQIRDDAEARVQLEELARRRSRPRRRRSGC